MDNRRAAIYFIVPIAIVVLLVFGLHFATRKGQVTIELQLPDLKSLSAKLDNKALAIRNADTTISTTPGKHTLDVSKSGYHSFSTAFTVTAGQTTVVNVTMQLTNPPSSAQSAPQNIQASLEQALSGFDIQNVVYFYNNTWAFVTLSAGDGNNGIAVASYDSSTGKWTMALGPGTGFTSDDVKGLPSNVVTYMKQNNYYAEL